MQNTVKNVHEVTLAEILDAREKRAELQKKLLAEYSATLISFTMNIAGPVKNTPVIERAFRHGLYQLLFQIPKEKVLFESSRSEPCGCEAFVSVNLSADTVKEICIGIEESSPLGRLFDMDVIDTDGKKLERKKERGCIVCGKAGRECAVGRLHSVEEIVALTNKIITDYFVDFDARRIGKLASECLISEVETTPKPGLVDLRNNGSHTDMSVDTFRKSAHALTPYFTECVKIGIETKSVSYLEAFSRLRKAGQQAEAEMYKATNGVNTHKGVIYSMGVLLGAVGRQWTVEQPIAKRALILSESSDLVRESIIADLAFANGSTAGERLFLEYGLKGIRGEVASGFSSVVNKSLPIYESALANGLTQNDAGVCSLISLIAEIDDTNLYHRGGADGAEYAKKYAKQLLSDKFNLKSVEEMDSEFIKRKLSPGGSADLLAITYFLHSIEKQK